MKLNNLQALRAFAALNVVFFHILGTSASYGFGVNDLKIFEGWGFNGVDIFFVLSGFIMVYIRGEGAMSPITFFVHRLTRIAPLYWLLTTLVLALSLVAPSIFRSDIAGIKIHTIASMFFMSQPLLSKSPVLFDGWTLEYEMLFYLCIAIGMFFKKISVTHLFVMLCISFLIAIDLIQPVAFEFLLGIFCGTLYLNFRNNKRLQLICLLIGISCFASTLILFKMEGDIFSQRVIMYGLPSFLIIYGLLGVSQIKRGALTKLGDASYSIYLIQVFTIPAFYKFANAFQGITNDMLAIACLLFTAIGGYLIHIFIEIKLTKYTRKYCKRFLMRV
ncbi:acyltransferase [Polynucleobacter paneuropaeus]|nr:acyltransferase [Polynucleobacter paneuropaeus]